MPPADQRAKIRSTLGAELGSLKILFYEGLFELKSIATDIRLTHRADVRAMTAEIAFFDGDILRSMVGDESHGVPEFMPRQAP